MNSTACQVSSSFICSEGLHDSSIRLGPTLLLKDDTIPPATMDSQLPDYTFHSSADLHEQSLAAQLSGTPGQQVYPVTPVTSSPRQVGDNPSIPLCPTDLDIPNPQSLPLKRPLRRSSRNVLSEGPRSTTDRINLAARVRSLEISPLKRVPATNTISSGSL